MNSQISLRVDERVKVVSGIAESDVFVSFEFEFRISLSSKFVYTKFNQWGNVILDLKGFHFMDPLMLMWFPISLSWF